MEFRPFLDVAKHSCDSCGQTRCFRHQSGPKSDFLDERAAFLADENWPEFLDFAVQNRRDGDILAAPLDAARWPKRAGAWPLENWEFAQTAPTAALYRALVARKNGAGGDFWRAQLRDSERLARSLETALTPDIRQIFVAQSLLPFLWQSGVLGGRRFAVLMTRWPLAELQSRLDGAFSSQNDASLADFRAPKSVVEAEREALDFAAQILTPHRAIAKLFGPRAHLLDWFEPPISTTKKRGDSLVFVGPALARKGALAVRDAARELGLPVVLVGRDWMGEAFWRGVEMRRAAPDEDWTTAARIVVQPALIEHQPRASLWALASGIPVVATPDCGLGERAGVFSVPFGDSVQLARAIETVWSAA